MISGKTKDFWWIQDSGLRLTDVVSKFPELFTDKFVAITSFDSGSLEPSEIELSWGWYSKRGVFYTPGIQNPRTLPHDTHDEWYIFDSPKEFCPPRRFVNYGNFMLRDPDYQLENVDPTWDKVGIRTQIEFQRAMQDEFWAFISEINPRAFIMDGELFAFGSRHESDFLNVSDLLQNK